jgi:hypothetical protein
VTATVPGRRMPFLRHAVLLAGILAIIAGILGMHVMSGSHSMPTAASGAEAVMLQVQGPAAGHSGHAAGTAVPGASEAMGAAAVPGCGCADPDGCATMSAMGTVCTPSLGNASLAAPAPGTTPLAALDVGAATAATNSYSYLPGSPSPGELSISRT